MQRVTDKTKVTCIRWVPGSSDQFVVSHASSQLYIYNKDLPCALTTPHYQPVKHGEGFAIHSCKAKNLCNPLYRWTIGDGCINEFAFTPCARYLAIASQDGYLRVFNYEAMELVSVMKSYFGGLLCACWSPDGKYVVTGGEDDLVTVWSFGERRVVCRGRGHKSWVNTVAFDPYSRSGDSEFTDFCGSDDDFCRSDGDVLSPTHGLSQGTLRASIRSNGSQTSNKSLHGSDAPNSGTLHSYRFGSIGHDTMLCLWDLTEDVLRQPLGRARTSTVISQNDVIVYSQSAAKTNNVSYPTTTAAAGSIIGNDVHRIADGNAFPHNNETALQNSIFSALPSGAAGTSNAGGVSQKFATLSLGERKEHKEHKWHFSLASRSSDSKIQLLKTSLVKPVDNAIRLLGTPACPRLDDAPLLEPLLCKKIAHERLTALVFREECIVTACQDGIVYTWARPGKVVSIVLA